MLYSHNIFSWAIKHFSHLPGEAFIIKHVVNQVLISLHSRIAKLQLIEPLTRPLNLSLNVLQFLLDSGLLNVY